MKAAGYYLGFALIALPAIWIHWPQIAYALAR